MSLRSLAAFLFLGLSLSGCATIIEGTTQPLAVTSLPAQGAKCTLQNSQGTYYVTTPGTVIVHKTKTDLKIKCTKVGYEDSNIVQTANLAATTASNVLAGGVIGLGVDAARGANYYYDSPVTVVMTPVPTAANHTADADDVGNPATSTSNLDADGFQRPETGVRHLPEIAVTETELRSIATQNDTGMPVVGSDCTVGQEAQEALLANSAQEHGFHLRGQCLSAARVVPMATVGASLSPGVPVPTCTESEEAQEQKLANMAITHGYQFWGRCLAIK